MKSNRKDRESNENSPHYCPLGVASIMDHEDNRLTIAYPVKRGKSPIENPDGPEKKKLRLDLYDDDVNRSASHPSTSPSEVKKKCNDKKKTPSTGNSNAAKKDSIEGARILNYTNNDVLSGRGGRTNLHPGNRYYRELILSNCSAYVKATKMMKPEIAHQIEKKIRERGGRFLRRGSDGMYCDIGESTAKEKTSQALRHRSFELRNLQDPNRAKMKGRWNKKKEQKKADKGNKLLPAKALVAPQAISKEGSSLPSIQPRPEEVNIAIVQQSLQGQSHEGKSDAVSHIPHTASPYHRYTDGLATSLRQSGDFLQSNGSISTEEQIRRLHSIPRSLDLRRFYPQNLSSGLHNNSFTHSNVLLNLAMQSIQPVQPIQPSHFSPPIFRGNSNTMNYRPPFPIHNNNDNLTNEMVERLIHLQNARMQAPSSPPSPFNPPR